MDKKEKPPAGSTVLTTRAEIRRPGKNTGPRATIGIALLDTGISSRKAAKIAGIGRTTLTRIRRQQKKMGQDATALNPKHVALVKATIRDKFLLAGNAAVDILTHDPAKLQDSTALELAKVASICLENAGLGPNSISEHHITVLKKYEIPAATIDITPSPALLVPPGPDNTQ